MTKQDNKISMTITVMLDKSNLHEIAQIIADLLREEQIIDDVAKTIQARMHR
ncbi:MAG: hypothetical protein JXA82_16545 [Sedimentisphaerales bacterium]|nr:hypothetical protein [Sedimentisphaerales bacterium]